MLDSNCDRCLCRCRFSGIHYGASERQLHNNVVTVLQDDNEQHYEVDRMHQRTVTAMRLCSTDKLCLRYCWRRWATWLLWTLALLTLGFAIALLLIPALPAMQASVNLYRHRDGAAVSSVEEEAAHDANSTVFNAFTSIGEVLGPIVGAAAVGHFTQVHHRLLTRLTQSASLTV
jgi:hypothetical protein